MSVQSSSCWSSLVPATKGFDLGPFLTIVVASAVGLLFSPAARAADIAVENFGADEPSIIEISGSIEAGDAQEFFAATEGIEQAIVLLSSPGGAVGDGLSIAAEIRSMGYTTAVLADKECYSACALISVAGAKRMMADTAIIGVHAAWREETIVDGSKIATESGVANADIGSFLTYVGLSREAIRYFTTAGPSELLPVTPEIAQRLDIDTAVIRSDRVVPVSERPTPLRLATEVVNYFGLAGSCSDLYGLDENWLKERAAERLALGHDLFGGDTFANLLPMAVTKQKDDRDRMGVRAWCEDAEYQLRAGKQPTGVIGPSFNCAKATTVTEHGICDAPGLWMPDRAMSFMFNAIHSKGSAASKRELNQRQRAWIQRRDACRDDVLCLADQYDAWFLNLTSIAADLP